jgi:steroid Delta-isomerase
MAAVEARDRQGWLALFAEDAVVEDPIGPSAFDPEGTGHRGLEAIADFYDNVIAANESIHFSIRQSFLCGDEAAYRRSPDDRIASLRAFWEPDAVRTVT